MKYIKKNNHGFLCEKIDSFEWKFLFIIYFIIIIYIDILIITFNKHRINIIFIIINIYLHLFNYIIFANRIAFCSVMFEMLCILNYNFLTFPIQKEFPYKIYLKSVYIQSFRDLTVTLTFIVSQMFILDSFWYFLFPGSTVTIVLLTFYYTRYDFLFQIDV